MASPPPGASSSRMDVTVPDAMGTVADTVSAGVTVERARTNHRPARSCV